jgi:putative endonuclease
VTAITAGVPPACNHDVVRDRRYYCVYILGSISGTLYIGFRGNLHKRIFQHKFHHFEGFTYRYEVVRLLYWESYDDVHKALAREKQLKRWSRAKKIALFERRNPQWKDLAAEWYPWMQPTQSVPPKQSSSDGDASTPR